ncbi:TRAP transporter large permease [Neoaquamicrobium sediminum]|jgi:tripartite ATP-independent transporter DctM subunit|uniref:TRAP transporter large permease n=1 Tax=Neoaquamicrobium sediminum TaxID=1849104 RepID=UPI001562F372|nr:TRAP transporter large permease subunit [Mesorhizobium sediminum]NRC55639.1 TRAP transporter large permease subunit [Mesorhizobium sediminum]
MTAIYNHLYDYLGGYMFIALALCVFTGFPVGLVLGGLALLFALGGIGLGVMHTSELYLFVERLWQTAANNQILVAVPCFIFMGIMLEQSQVASNLLRVLQVMLRRVPGGLALAVTLLGTILAATTGIIGASVVMLTMMALPAMIAQKYDVRLGTGTVAASATLGILLPPSVMLVMMADLMAISVGDLFLAAILPGLMLAFLYCVYIVALAAFRPDKAPAVQRAEDEVGVANLIGMVVKGFLPIVFLISLVLGSIFAGWATPTEASGIGAFGAILLAWFNGKLTRASLDKVCMQTALTSAMIFLIFAGATAFSYVFRALYGEDLILDFIAWMGLTHWSLLFLLMVVIFLLGFFFDWLEITLIILPVFAPIIASFAPDFAPALGIEHLPAADQRSLVLLWFAILVSVNLQTSFLTPPFGFALFFLKGAAPRSVKIGDIYRGIMPFVGIQLFGVLLLALFPAIVFFLL